MAKERIKWYRNASEKDHDNVHGEGTLMAIRPMQNNSGGSAVIVDDEGNFVEKDLSLIRLDKGPQVNTKAIVEELNLTIEANGKLSDDLNVLQSVKVKLTAEVKDLKDKLAMANAKDGALKSVKDLAPKKK